MLVLAAAAVATAAAAASFTNDLEPVTTLDELRQKLSFTVDTTSAVIRCVNLTTELPGSASDRFTAYFLPCAAPFKSTSIFASPDGLITTSSQERTPSVWTPDGKKESDGSSVWDGTDTSVAWRARDASKSEQHAGPGGLSPYSLDSQSVDLLQRNGFASANVGLPCVAVEPLSDAALPSFDSSVAVPPTRVTVRLDYESWWDAFWGVTDDNPDDIGASSDVTSDADEFTAYIDKKYGEGASADAWHLHFTPFGNGFDDARIKYEVYDLTKSDDPLQFVSACSLPFVGTLAPESAEVKQSELKPKFMGVDIRAIKSGPRRLLAVRAILTPDDADVVNDTALADGAPYYRMFHKVFETGGAARPTAPLLLLLALLLIAAVW